MLGAPPAFVLSQDQTLNLIILKLLYRSNKLFLRTTLTICSNRFVALNYLFGFSKEIRVFVHSHILFNFQVPCEISFDLTSFLLTNQFGFFYWKDFSFMEGCLSWQLCYYIMLFPFCQEVFWSFLKKFFEEAFSFSTNFSPHFTNSFHQDCASIQFSSYIHVRFELFEFVSHATAYL